MTRAPDTDSLTDDALVARARAGEVRALDHLLERHQGRVLRVLRLLGVPAQDREDVAQEVLVRVFRHLDGFRAGRSFGGWVYRITVNAAHDYRHGTGRRARGEVPWGEGREAEGLAGAGEEGGRALELREALEAALVLLSERERAVFVLRELEGLETREVARSLGITTITVRRHLGRARRRLQTALSPFRKKKESSLNAGLPAAVVTHEGEGFER